MAGGDILGSGAKEFGVAGEKADAVAIGGEFDGAEETGRVGGGFEGEVGAGIGLDADAPVIAEVGGSAVDDEVAQDRAASGLRFPGQIGRRDVFVAKGGGDGAIEIGVGFKGTALGVLEIGVGVGVKGDSSGAIAGAGGSEGAVELSGGAFDGAQVVAKPEESEAVVLAVLLVFDPAVEEGAVAGLGEVVHGQGEIENAFLEPGAPVLINGGEGVARAVFGVVQGSVAPGDESAADLHLGLQLEDAEIDLPDELRHLAAAEVGPGGVAGGGSAGAAGLTVEAFDGGRVVAEVAGAGDGFGVADVVEVDAVDVVVLDDVRDDADDMGEGIGVSEVNIVRDAAGGGVSDPVIRAFNVGTVGVPDVIGVLGWGGGKPKRRDREPGVDFDAAGVGAFGEVLKGIEGWGPGAVLGEGFKGVEVEGIAAEAGLHEDGVGARGGDVVEHLLDFGGRFEAAVEAVGPIGAVLLREDRRAKSK